MPKLVTWMNNQRVGELMCQTFGLPSSVKYESDGGPGIAQIMAFLMGSSEALKDRYDL